MVGLQHTAPCTATSDLTRPMFFYGLLYLAWFLCDISHRAFYLPGLLGHSIHRFGCHMRGSSDTVRTRDVRRRAIELSAHALRLAGLRHRTDATAPQLHERTCDAVYILNEPRCSYFHYQRVTAAAHLT